ncbi:Lrp/AsnC family transcriptional regulator [Sinomonas sp. ASV322]|uniref:Lrp/AsnC family transcriptional regulator n=1 Tax=Sinomonas sp. ASV322 TaxID=3041920 RepID=UPI0027DDDE8E|nr:Lrp/AsnC family transcriptional regulator [Sinomonas sp. ASV322]MDQ4502530.1 Lrp/AsnC family transcriptional regulator [Sinomonas sp. ASV322]
MDSIDRAIVTELQRDGRLSNQDLADRVGLSPSPCLRRVRQLETDGVITGYRADVSAKALGLPITVFVTLTLERHAVETTEVVEERINALENVTECYLLAGDGDYLLKVAIGSLEEYEDLVRSKLRSIPAIASIRTSFAYSTIKKPSPLPVRA